MDLFQHGPRPVTAKQLQFAEAIAHRSGAALSDAVKSDRAALAAWIDGHKNIRSPQPSSRQVAFAERIARIKRRQVPDICFRDRQEMARWIDRNKP